MSAARGLLLAALLAISGASAALAGEGKQEAGPAQPASEAHTDKAAPEPAATCDSCAARKQNLRKLYDARSDKEAEDE